MAARFWVGGTGTWDGTSTTHWAATSNGSPGASAPTTADTVTFDSNSGTGVVTTAAGSTCSTTTLNSSNIELSLGANHTQTGAFTLTLGTLSLNSYNLTSSTFVSSNSNVRTVNFGTGKLTLSGSGTTILNTGTMTGMVVTGSRNVEFSYAGSTGQRSITPASLAGGSSESIAFNLKFLSGTDIVAFSSGRAFGTVDFDGFAGSFTTNSMVVYGDFKLSSGMTISASTGTLNMGATSGTKTITTNGKTIDQPISFSGSAVFQFADALTQGSTRAFTLTNGTVKLKAGVTSTVGAFATSGTTQKYLQSTTPGTQATLSQASGTVTASYLTIQDIAATGGAAWLAYVDYNNVDNGDNSGWDFSNSPAIDNEFPIALRSFTQPKRF